MTATHPEMIDRPPTDRTLSISTIAQRLGKEHQTVLKWILAGVRDRNGVRVRLAANKPGGRWVVMLSDLEGRTEEINKWELEKEAAEQKYSKSGDEATSEGSGDFQSLLGLKTRPNDSAVLAGVLQDYDKQIARLKNGEPKVATAVSESAIKNVMGKIKGDSQIPDQTKPDTWLKCRRADHGSHRK